MVKTQLETRGVADPEVLRAMSAVPRHRFVPPEYQAEAYDDNPLPIGHSQTISQPYIVALMTELSGVQRGDKVLEVGTGCGYQAAVLAEITDQVYSIEIVPALVDIARRTLEELGYSVNLKSGDGYVGWREHAPFKAIIVTAAPDHVPPALIEQLAVGGRLVIPVGVQAQNLIVIKKTERGLEQRNIIPVRFVPMTGAALRDFTEH
ncbi:MAG: protein-L-isoaspartate(D-aspartate) O-methyltransferase [Spirochaetia bacterium]|nr:protein-L-isoaspartate(D-aspartate) O-methyltransferase [Spirochaetia bacterium]